VKEMLVLPFRVFGIAARPSGVTAERSSSFGISRPFRVLGPVKYRPYCFCDPAVPLVPYLGCAVFHHRTGAVYD
jgi:hypothetical protein